MSTSTPPIPTPQTPMDRPPMDQAPRTQNPYAPLPPQPAARRGRGVALIAGAGVAALLGGVVGGGVGYLLASNAETAAPVAAVAPVVNTPAVASEGGSVTSGAPFTSIADLAAAVQPAVVQLNVTGAGGEGTGSGFIISDDGYIITNNHVAGPAAKDGRIEVSFLDGRTATGKVIGTNPGYDLAVVKVDRTGLPTLPLGRSKEIKVGDAVIAIGSPLGLQGTVTTGIVSALNRPVTAGDAQAGEETAFINAIQTDAGINPGNSGGPLVDSTGAVIGVNSAIASMAVGPGQAGSIGLGFAIPIDTAKRIADELIKTGSSSTPVVGVKLQMDFEGPGAKIVDITGKPATESSLRVDDIITKVDGQRIADPTALIVTIRSYAPGDSVTLTVDRDGQTLTVPVTLEASKN